MHVRDLIDRCCNNDPEAWATLWEIVSSAALYPIRRLLHRQGLGLELADDVMQEFYLHIREDNLRHLRSFRGDAMPQFRAFIRTLAIHFALNTLRKVKRMQRLEDEVARTASRPDRSGPTASQIRRAMQELASLMSHADRAKVLQLLRDQSLLDDTLLNILDKTEPAHSSPRSRRTHRRWREELYRKYLQGDS
jgi:DNA-directed RNA polymerase specialized sigma24 family protein